ncbi:uncharacterized protein [Panulirus ornatus]|uniref:uncharacterized protein n=1 Tax=Panulirus ornatus TaxID=150431 RepID=UPI003A8B8864
MMKVAFVLVVAACCLPAHVLSMWPSTSYYVDFIITKNCFGEDIAMEMERTGLKVGRSCWMEEWKNTFGWPEEQGARKKRNILKMPSTPSERLLACNLRGLNLMTEDNEMNYDTVNMWLDAKITDPVLKDQLLELSLECQNRPFTFPGLPMKKPMEPPLRGVLAFRTYMDCMNTGGTRICRNKEMKLVQKKMEMV